ncbi:hypothetical protein L1049_022370 [Liquidambar formosana]|uniref:Uncharacterized protein n=1 Tax=Liquidambar formosana TaxID=63359 RepID=A0AAP0WQ42_LIQFO
MKTTSNPNLIAKKSSKTKKIDRFESSLKELNHDLSLFKFKSGAVVALVLFVVFGLLNSLFKGKVVAKLPFVPVRIIQKMSHRGLHSHDAIDCLMAFLYFLCSISIRTNLQKFLGFSPLRGAPGGKKAIIFALMGRSESELGEPLTRLLPLGLGLLYLGKQVIEYLMEACIATFNSVGLNEDDEDWLI